MTDQKASPKTFTEARLPIRSFSPPETVSGVLRPRLFEALTPALAAPLTLVSASAGFGKTTLVAQWLCSQPELRASWLGLEPSDDEPAQFFRSLAAAWQRVCPRAGEAALAELQGSHLPPLEALLRLLLQDLSGAPGAGLILVLDDYHRIEQPEIHRAVACLVDHLPAHCHLVLITRIDPPLPLARWRARRSLVELRADDLRFTPPETAAFLNEWLGLRLAGNWIAALEARTEGWVVGLQLAALALERSADRESFIASFSGSHRFVLDYLLEEVMDHQPGEVQEFLLASAPLDSFSGPLCDAVLGQAAPYSQRMLERLEKANLFLVPLDEQRRWFRYHHLFADLLRVRLHQAAANRLPGLFERAANWFAQNQLWREAILYAVRAKDYSLGAAFFRQALLSDGLSFLMHDMRSLIDPFPADQMAADPLLGLAKAMSLVAHSQLQGIETLLRGVEKEIEAAPAFAGQSELMGMVYVVQGIAAALLGDSRWMVESSRQVIRRLPLDGIANFNACIQMGTAAFYEGDFHQFDACWLQALQYSEASNFQFGRLCCLENLARLACHQGDLNRAEASFQRLLQICAEIPSPRWLAETRRDYSDLLRERNRLEEAQEMMAASLAAQDWEMASGQGLGTIHMGRILLARGDLPGAAAMLVRAQELCRSHTVYPDLAAIVDLFQVRLFMAQGDFERARRGLQDSLSADWRRHELHQEWALITLAELELRAGQPQQALKQIEGRRAAAQENGRGANWLAMTLLAALALQDLGELSRSLDLLQEGLVFALPQGFVRAFIDPGEPMRRLLSAFCQQRPGFERRAAVQALLGLLPGPPANPQPGSPANLVEPLTAREQEILRLVCAGYSNQEIAEQLVVSVGTVKTHIHHILGKLGVSNRPQAMALASQLGLFPPTL